MKTLFLTLLALAPLAATAADGPGSDGGANSIKICVADGSCEQKLIENYHVDDLSEIKGYEIYQQKLEMIRKDLPELAAAIEKAADKKQWYKVPANFHLIEKDMIKTNFDTEQAAYQNDKEVFVSQYALDQMTDEAAAYKIMHEAVMAMQNPREVIAVRSLVSKIFAKSPDYRKIQEAAAKNGFGLYFSAKQTQQQRESVRESYLDYNASTFADAAAYCDTTDKNRWVRSAMHPSDREKLEIVLNALDGFNGENDDKYPYWKSALLWRNLGMRKPTSTNREYEAIRPSLSSAAGKHPDDYTEDFRDAISHADATRAEKERLEKVLDRLTPAMLEDAFRIREKLAENPAFIDLMAIRTRLGSDLNAEEIGDHTNNVSPEFRRLEPIYRQVLLHLNSVPTVRFHDPLGDTYVARDPKSLLERVCKDLKSVLGDTDALQSSFRMKYEKPRNPAELFDDGQGSDASKPSEKGL